VRDLPEDEEGVWFATYSALQSKGATHTEAVEGAKIILEAYRKQRRALKEPSPESVAAAKVEKAG
jgi:hypothetical protein